MFRSLNPDSAHGRQTEARRNDRAVLDAARDVFSAQGADAPISAVAERAGVGVGTLYRRYGSKTELLQRMCVLAMEQGIEAAGEALEADDAWTGLCGYIRACVEMRSGALGSLAGQIEMTDDMLSTARRGMTLAREVVARAHRAGPAARRNRPRHRAPDRVVQPPRSRVRRPGGPDARAAPVGSGRGAQRAGQAADGRVRRAARARRDPAAWQGAERQPVHRALVSRAGSGKSR